MKNYQTLGIAPEFILSVIKTRPNFNLSDVEKKHIDTLFKEQKSRRRVALHEGKVLNFVSFNGVQLIGEFVEYKYYIAQQMDLNLKATLNIHPITMSGFTISGDKILVGKRAEHVYECPGHLELVPSGGIEPEENEEAPINLAKQIMRELKEETGIDKVKSIKPFELVYDRDKGLYEIGLALVLEEEKAKQPLHPTKEYPKLYWWTKQELEKHLSQEKWVPLSLFFFENYYSKITAPNFPDNMFSKP